MSLTPRDSRARLSAAECGMWQELGQRGRVWRLTGVSGTAEVCDGRDGFWRAGRNRAADGCSRRGELRASAVRKNPAATSLSSPQPLFLNPEDLCYLLSFGVLIQDLTPHFSPGFGWSSSSQAGLSLGLLPNFWQWMFCQHPQQDESPSPLHFQE